MAHQRVPSDKRVNRGLPTQEGEQAGVAFLLVTFLWPRKEKSLAQARRAGETLSRAEPSRPMGRSRIKGSTAGSGFRRASVAVEREFAAVQCAELIAPYGVPLRGEAAPPYQLRERLITLR